jgi:segregation and condensation protein B
LQAIQLHIEALIFASEQSISTADITLCLNQALNLLLTDSEVQVEIEHIKEKYTLADLALELVFMNGGYQFMTRKEFNETLQVLIQQKAKKKLSSSSMETLAIIAYRQPITKPEVEQIRGVNCDYSIQKLLEKELISISGKSDAPGRPLLYSTSKLFADYFGIASEKDLPQLKDIQAEENEIGVKTDN